MATKEADPMCVCDHPLSQHEDSGVTFTNGDRVFKCTVESCACGPGCIREGFIGKVMTTGEAPIEVEYRAEGAPAKDGGFRTRWKATCPAVEGFRVLTDRRLTSSRASALCELSKQAVDPETIVHHVIVDGEERYRFGVV